MSAVKCSVLDGLLVDKLQHDMGILADHEYARDEDSTLQNPPPRVGLVEAGAYQRNIPYWRRKTLQTWFGLLVVLLVATGLFGGTHRVRDLCSAVLHTLMLHRVAPLSTMHTCMQSPISKTRLSMHSKKPPTPPFSLLNISSSSLPTPRRTFAKHF